LPSIPQMLGAVGEEKILTLLPKTTFRVLGRLRREG
jgi:hypothetical protein